MKTKKEALLGIAVNQRPIEIGIQESPTILSIGIGSSSTTLLRKKQWRTELNAKTRSPFDYPIYGLVELDYFSSDLQTGDFDLEIAVNPIDQSYVLVWQDWRLNGQTDIFSRRYAADGSPLGNVTQVNVNSYFDQMDVDVSMDNSGAYVVTWDSYVLTWDSFNVTFEGHVPFVRRYAADGTPLDAIEFEVDLTPSLTSTHPTVAYTASGDFVVAWEVQSAVLDSDVFAQRFSAAGEKIGTRLRVNSQSNGSQGWPPSLWMPSATSL